jgi:hypothetical protein
MSEGPGASAEAGPASAEPYAGPRLRLSVVLDGDPTPAWQARALDRLQASPLIEVLGLDFQGRARRGRAERCFERLERTVLQLDPGAQAAAPQAGAQPARTGGAPTAAADTSEGLLLWLAHAPPPAQSHGGVLHLRHAGRDEPAERAVLRALRDGAGSIETTLLLSDARGTAVLARTVSGVRPYSPAVTLDLMLWKLAALVPRTVERLAEGDPVAERSAQAPAPAPGAPSRAAALPPLGVLLRTALRWPSLLLKRLRYRRPWAIRLRSRAADPVAGWTRGEELVRWQRGHIYADPFLVEQEGRHHLFCEEVPATGGFGVISHVELRLDGTPAGPPREVLSAPYHLSYPFVFSRRGEIFMIPETSSVARVELYRAVEFPHRWERECVLLEGLDAADATLLEHEGRLWLFASVAAADASSLDELHLFFAGELRGPWRAHPRNPVVSDARCARPAGAIQDWGGRLVRPGQDGSRRYGGAISFREIDRLSEREYAEHEVARIEPGDLGDARATHTYNADSRFEAIDLRRLEPRFGHRGSRGASLDG